MNLAIEYLLRDDKVHNLLTLPCSLFLTCDKGKLIVTIHNSYGNQSLLIKHWQTWNTKPENKLPPFEEFKIDRKNVFTRINDCTILPYDEEPFSAGSKQYTSWPQSSIQEVEYNDSLDNYLNSKKHQLTRLNWLWEQFQLIYVSGDLRILISKTDDFSVQREMTEFYARHIWSMWLYWRKYLLDFHGVAAELVFSNLYPKPKKINWGYHLWSGLEGL